MSASTPAVTASDLRRSIEYRGDARWSVWLYALVAILLLAMAWGLFVRFNALGSRPLAVDEYFSATAVRYVLDKGVPEFPTGGYYMRGLPLQYLQAGSVLLFGDNECAIYFCLHLGSLPENTAERQPRFWAKPAFKKFRKKLYVRQNRSTWLDVDSPTMNQPANDEAANPTEHENWNILVGDNGIRKTDE
jgi:hypothetical protein